MKLLILILFPFIANAQYVQWTTANETDVINYVIQYSADQQNWTALATIQPIKKDTNVYAYTIPNVSQYYRIMAKESETNYYTESKLLIPNKKPSVKISPSQNINIKLKKSP